MDRPNETLIPADTRWLIDPDAQIVCRAIAAGGHQILFVGGCVRNALLGRADSDVDLATDARPERVMDLAKAAGLKAVPTGIDHGTITVVSGGKGFEITTFRRDVETDGRRAVVAFSDTIHDDASRRDFTMNALYCTPEGQVIDPLGGGLPDLRAGRVRFIEDPNARITEDYLRILRYFRFYAWYADPTEGFDPDALDAISRNSDGLETLSAERVGAEMRKLLAAPDPAPAIAQMRQTGVLQVILPGSDDTWLGPVVHQQDTLGRSCDWQVRLAALGGEEVADRLRLSKADARKLGDLRDLGFGAMPLPEVAFRYGAEMAIGALILRTASAGRHVLKSELDAIEEGASAEFPVKARDLMPDYTGKALGDQLEVLKHRWIASRFSLSKADLLRSG